MVPNMRAVLKKASWGTRCIIGSIRCKKQAPGVRLASRNDPSGEGTQKGTQKAVRNSLQKATRNGTQNGTREATQNAIFICEIKDLS